MRPVPHLIIVISVVLSSTWPAMPGQTSEADLQSPVISMTRLSDGIFALPDRRDIRQNPSYSISIAVDGTVSYEGRSGVRTLGKRTHKIPVASVRALIAEFEQAGFMSLRDRYDSIDLGNGTVQTVSDLPPTTVVLALAGKTKSVYDYYGTPSIVKRLEERIDEVADSRRYTGRPPNKRLQPTARALSSR